MRRPTALLLLPTLLLPLTAAPAAAADVDQRNRTHLTTTGECRFGGKPIPGRPWALQRVQLDRLWAESQGEGVRVAVIDSGVDVRNPQLRPAVDVGSGRDFVKPKKDDPENLPKGPTVDLVGHGTKVAGIIAARPDPRTGFVGLAPKATIIPIRQNDGEGGGNAENLAQSVDHAVRQGADVINISQDADRPLGPDSLLYQAVRRAIDAGVVVVASAGNDGADGKLKETYPAAIPGVLAVAASDRNNERAVFSQRGHFVGIAAPGVDIVSTVPRGGHCADNGTSFAAPYVAAVAALLRAKHRRWTPQQIVAQLQQTAERPVSGRDHHIGWGVVDPLRALTEDERPITRPVGREGVENAPAPEPAELTLTETYAQRNERLGTYALLVSLTLTALVACVARILRDRRRHRSAADR
ncbi:type VII secretion-associated serine protease mycosin [Streptomyces sp. OF3]|uniref:Type VII secretion-associated serine protease mycosin n=1 Tax=Streptomyces alkaliterrae TaxID=2213162 RepID=A0A7W3WPF8_9ACTN|nr:type VII secretion-associated serine protease mycosin [Streptomyces alkaliterrae]MBB1256097.1 type VII secretion-associated serine protease mycosin [Streptomyces alkaliterrae]